MRKGSRAAGAAIIGSVLLLAPNANVQAAEVRVLAIGALPGALAQLGPQFEQASDHKLIIQYGATPALIKKIEAGEPFDVAILIADMMNDPSRQGLFAAGARPTISSVGLGAAVRAGAPKPDIGSAEASSYTSYRVSISTPVPLLTQPAIALVLKTFERYTSQ